MFDKAKFCKLTNWFKRLRVIIIFISNILYKQYKATVKKIII